jgi:hypothetical protein
VDNWHLNFGGAFEMITDKLREIMLTKQIVSVYDDNDEDKFDLGYVLALTDKHCVLASITPACRYGGYVFIQNENIRYISYQGSYEDNILKLCNHYGTTHKDFEFVGIDLLSEFLSLAMEQHFAISLELQNNGFPEISGFVDKLDKETCTIHVLTDYGEYDGYSVINLDSITEISCDSEKDRMRKFLSENK